MKKPAKKLYAFANAILLIGVVFFSVSFSSLSFAQEQSVGSDNFEDIVLSVRLENETLSEGIFGFQRGETTYVPVGMLANIFGIYTRYEEDFYAGFVFEEENSFAVNRAANTLTARGQTVALPEGAIAPESLALDDIYLDSTYFQRFWPLSLDVNRFGLSLEVVADKELPFAAMLRRKKRQEELAKKQIEEDVELPFLAYPYQLYSKPVVSLNSSVAMARGQDELTTGLSITGRNDLLYAQADYTVNLNTRAGEFIEPESIRLRFQRENIHEGALPFGIENAEWGDVGLRNRTLIGSNLSGRGAKFTTQERRFGGEFDLITIDGISNPGWETELYVNKELRRFGEVESDGTYIFEDISVGFGRNDIKVVFYGPQGQRLEREETYVYRSNMVKPGEYEIAGGIVDQAQPLIELRKPEIDTRPEGFGGNIYAARGINERLTVFASGTLINERIGLENERQRYLTAGALVSFDNFSAQAELYNQMDGGRAIDLRGLTQFMGVNLNAQAAFYSDFENQRSGFGDNAKDFEFDFNARRVFSTALGNLGLQIGVDHESRENGNDLTVYRSRQSFGVKRVNITNDYRMNYSNSKLNNATGSIVASTNYRKFNLRSDLSYNTYPDRELVAVGANLLYRIDQDYSAGLNLQHNFQNRTNLIAANISRRFEQFTGSAGIDWDSEGGLGFALRANTTLGPFGDGGSYIASSDPLRSSGPISTFTYHDKDYDGIFSEGDVPVENVKIRANNRILDDATNEAGYLFDVSPAGINREVEVSVIADSIEDPYFIPGNPGYRVFPRPGVVHNIQIPLIETGAIDGTVRYSNGRPIGGLELELMDIDGEIRAKSITAADGYFTFEKIKPGSFTIRAAPQSGAIIPFKYVDLTPDSLFQFGMDITAIDLEGTDSNLDIGFQDDGQMKANNILSLAKGIKGRAPEGFYDEKGKGKSGKNQKSKPSGSQFKEKKPDISNIEPSAGEANTPIDSSNITGVRIGKHPGKERVVLDLSKKTAYNVNYDEQNNQIIVEMPNAKWSAKDTWSTSKKAIVSQYQVEPFESGVKLIMAVTNGAKVAKSGLLNADHGKKDRLYIDIVSN